MFSILRKAEKLTGAKFATMETIRRSAGLLGGPLADERPAPCYFRAARGSRGGKRSSLLAESQIETGGTQNAPFRVLTEFISHVVSIRGVSPRTNLAPLSVRASDPLAESISLAQYQIVDATIMAVALARKGSSDAVTDSNRWLDGSSSVGSEAIASLLCDD